MQLHKNFALLPHTTGCCLVHTQERHDEHHVSCQAMFFDIFEGQCHTSCLCGRRTKKSLHPCFILPVHTPTPSYIFSGFQR